MTLEYDSASLSWPEDILGTFWGIIWLGGGTLPTRRPSTTPVEIET